MTIRPTQIADRTERINIGSAINEKLSNQINLIDDSLFSPLRITATGVVFTVGPSVLQKKESDLANGTQNSYKWRVPLVGGMDVSFTDYSTLSLTTGALSGSPTGVFDASVTAGAPSLLANDYVQMGVEVRSDSKLYVVWGTEHVSLGSTTAPRFTSGSLAVCVVKLRNSNSAGQWKFAAPLKSDIEIIKVGSSGGNGSGSGRINYIMNPTLDVDIIGYGTYTDAASATPEDGDPATPATHVTVTKEITNPLYGLGSLKISKSEVNSQGEGVSYDFTTSRISDGNMVEVSFDYLCTTTQAINTKDLLDFVAIPIGNAGNAITVTYTAGGAHNTAVVSVVGSAISVQIDDGDTLASVIKAAIDLHAVASTLVTCSLNGADAVQSVGFAISLSGGRGPIADDDLSIWLYKKDATAGIRQPVPYQLKATTIPGRFKAFIQLDYSSTLSTVDDWRLIFHVSSVSTVPWDVIVDNILVGPPQYNFGAPITDWKAYTPTLTGTGGDSTSYAAQRGMYRRVGDSVEVYLNITAGTGAQTAPTGAYRISLPSGLSIDLSKATASNGVKGVGSFWDSSGSVNIPIAVQYHSAMATPTFVEIGSLSATAIPTWAANDQFNIWFVAPVLGWSSSVQMSDDAETRRVSCTAHRAGSDQLGLDPNNTFVKINLTSAALSNYVGEDTHAMLNASGGIDIKVSGEYDISAQTYVLPANVLGSMYNLGVSVGSTFSATQRLRGPVFIATAGDQFGLGVTGKLKLVAGNKVWLGLFGSGNNSSSTLGIAGDTFFTQFNVSLRQGPSAIAASESVHAKYQVAGVVAISSAQPANYATRIYDTHGSVTVGASWKFTAPRSGYYSVKCNMLTDGTGRNIALYKNGVADSTGSAVTASPASSSFTVQLNMGEYVDIRTTNAISINLSAGAVDNWICVDSIS